jgi:dephospho-CoA kinase
VFRIGLTGGIGSGKSAVASFLRDLGAHVIVADEVSREQAVPGGPVLAALVDEFGPSILRPDGTLRRDELGRLAFSSARGLERLNAITHPALVAAILERMERLERDDPSGVVVVDAALLVDWDILDAFDLVVAVDAPRETRLRRLTSAGLDEDAARARMGAQAPEEAFAHAADVVIENDGTLDGLRDRVAELWERVMSRPEGGPG